jgi:hypothetical protein
MATQLTIVNNILRRLREDEVNSIADNTYAKLIAQFVNDAKADIEDYNHEWSVYITAIDHTLLADGSTREYDLSTTTDRSWLMRDPEDDQYPLAFDVTADNVGQLFDISQKRLLKERAATNNPDSETESSPYYFAVKADADGRGWTFEHLWALASSATARTIRSYWYVPQADLALDGTDNSTEIKLPSRCIELRAMFYALNERGEEMGMYGGIADKRATDAIAAAMEVDATMSKKIAELDITNRENI